MMIQWLTRKSDTSLFLCIMGVIALGLCLPFTQSSAIEPSLLKQYSPQNVSQPSGTILITGNGPERYLMETLANAFEQEHPSISVDFFWHPNAKPIRTIELHEAEESSFL